MIIKTRPADNAKMASHLVVFRNQQQVFLPAMSDNEEVQYWRILKNDDGATDGTPIKDGDEIRLCWSFQDQLTGWRDYSGDVFGRRRNLTPPGLAETVLFLKVPWPRFEKAVNLDTEPPPPHAMIMAPIQNKDADEHKIHVLNNDGKTQREETYAVQDVVLRIDTVTNRGLGDSNDYMLREITQSGNERTIDIKFRGGMLISQRIFWL